ncbi:hypothetical protein MK079_05235, partial [Candidatus Gracilibacteria bacterium]|nr:hypothetical protein [Candidatus Gracilibacteria bacterium]
MDHISHIQNNSSKTDGTNESLESSDVVRYVENILGNKFDEIITHQDVYLSSALYLIYWYHRTRNNPTKQAEMLQNISEYFGSKHIKDIKKVLENSEIKQGVFEHVEGNVLIQPTVDIVVEQENNILCIEREWFPKGPALIGGLLLDEDEDNILNIEPKIFAALRIAGKKIITGECIYYEDENNYYVSNPQKSLQVKLEKDSTKGYKYKDKVTRMIEPSDPRHMVDTRGFQMEVVGNVQDEHLVWINKNDILNLENQKGGLAFGHHRQIVAELHKQEQGIDQDSIDHHNWVRGIIENPLENYQDIKERFEKNNNHPETPCPELLPIVKKMIHDLYSDDINSLCAKDTFAVGERHFVDNALKHCFSDNQKVCPYRSTLYAIMDAIKFFDIIARMKIGFYDEWSTDTFNEQDPRKQQYAYFFNHKYKNHLDAMLAKFPDEIIIPTYEHLGATDLMKVRGIPLRFVGLSNEFLYVDEFWQSPVEFLGHDGDHSVRMAYEDEKYCEKNNILRDEFIKASTQFGNTYLKNIKIKKTDSIEEKELKKLKKLVLFEIIHEDSKPFMKDVIIDAIKKEEGFDIHRENIITDPQTGYMTREHTVETHGGISPLAF